MTREELLTLRRQSFLALKGFFALSLEHQGVDMLHHNQLKAAAELHAACCRELTFCVPHLSTYARNEIAEAILDLGEAVSEVQIDLVLIEDAKQSLANLMTAVDQYAGPCNAESFTPFDDCIDEATNGQAKPPTEENP